MFKLFYISGHRRRGCHQRWRCRPECPRLSPWQTAEMMRAGDHFLTETYCGALLVCLLGTLLGHQFTVLEGGQRLHFPPVRGRLRELFAQLDVNFMKVCKMNVKLTLNLSSTVLRLVDDLMDQTSSSSVISTTGVEASAAFLSSQPTESSFSSSS